MTAVICVAELTVYEAAGVLPNNTAEAPDRPVNPVPLMTTVAPPDGRSGGRSDRGDSGRQGGGGGVSTTLPRTSTASIDQVPAGGDEDELHGVHSAGHIMGGPHVLLVDRRGGSPGRPSSGRTSSRYTSALPVVVPFMAIQSSLVPLKVTVTEAPAVFDRP